MRPHGSFDEETHEWANGILTVEVRRCSADTSGERKWILFDGPVEVIRKRHARLVFLFGRVDLAGPGLVARYRRDEETVATARAPHPNPFRGNAFVVELKARIAGFTRYDHGDPAARRAPFSAKRCAIFRLLVMSGGPDRDSGSHPSGAPSHRPSPSFRPFALTP